MIAEKKRGRHDWTSLWRCTERCFSFTSHSFVVFAPRGWGLPVVGVERSQAWSSFICATGLFLRHHLLLAFVIFALLAYLASGCKFKHTISTLVPRWVFDPTPSGPRSHVSRVFSLVGNGGAGPWELFSSSSSSLSLGSLVSSWTTDSVSGVESSCKCFSAKKRAASLLAFH